MSWSPNGKYVYSMIYDIIGNYSFYVIIEDIEGRIINTTRKFFWITLEKDDDPLYTDGKILRIGTPQIKDFFVKYPKLLLDEWIREKGKRTS